MSEKKELNKEQLEKVSGGANSGRYTYMLCKNSSCGYSTKWNGAFLGQVFDCPKCGEHTFEGVELGAIK